VTAEAERVADEIAALILEKLTAVNDLTIDDMFGPDGRARGVPEGAKGRGC